MADNDDTRERLIAVEIRADNTDKTVQKLAESIEKLSENQAKLYRLAYIALGAYMGIQFLKGVNIGGILSKAVGV